MTHSRQDTAARRRLLQVLGAAPLAGLAWGCESIVPGQGPPPTLFRLTPKSTFSAGLPTVKWQLILEAPLTDAALSTTRIALWPNPTRLEYYARANWSDRAPAMVQTLLIESFENSGKIVSVGRESIGLRADFVLKTELREFQANYHLGGNPKAQVGINAKLVKMPNRLIVGSQMFEALIDAEADRLADIIEAFDDALGKVLKRVVEWTLITGEQHAGRRRS